MQASPLRLVKGNEATRLDWIAVIDHSTLEIAVLTAGTGRHGGNAEFVLEAESHGPLLQAKGCSAKEYREHYAKCLTRKYKQCSVFANLGTDTSCYGPNVKAESICSREGWKFTVPKFTHRSRLLVVVVDTTSTGSKFSKSKTRLASIDPLLQAKDCRASASREALKPCYI